jgi:hypothetical protein
MTKSLAPVHPAEVWIGLRAEYDLQIERDRHGAEIERSVLVPR